jgi:flagellar motor switch protein FliN/FliY
MSSTFTVAQYADALVAELSTAFEAVLGGSVSATNSAPPQGDGWSVTFTATGDLVGTITAWMDRAGSAVLAQRVTGVEGPPDDAVVADMLKEMWSQGGSALSLKEPFTGVKVALGAPVPGDAGDGHLASYTMAFAADASVQVAVTAAAEVAVPVPAPLAVAAPKSEAAPLGSIDAPGARPSAGKSSNLEVVLDIEMPLIVRFGRTLMTLKTLAALGPGSILDMGRSPDEPVEILVGEQVIARGEVVIVDGKYGVRITDLVSPSDRVRALEA